MSFNKLTLAELVRTANEDFAFELSPEEQKSKKLALAAFTEAQLKFTDYLKANPAEAEKYAEIAAQEQAVQEAALAATPVVAVVPVVEETPDYVASAQPWLIKMVRENPHYEIGRYKFTDEHPYVLVLADDVEAVLSIDGFRQAKPSELSEYYG